MRKPSRGWELILAQFVLPVLAGIVVIWVTAGRFLPAATPQAPQAAKADPANPSPEPAPAPRPETGKADPGSFEAKDPEPKDIVCAKDGL
jgi:hypothetical protein